MRPPACPTCGDKMLDDSDGLTGGWLCANGHRAEIMYTSAAPATETPRQMRPAKRAGRLIVVSIVSGLVAGMLVWWMA